MPDAVPSHALALRSLVTDSGRVSVSLDEVEVPEPAPDEVVVRVEAAPINPSDLGLLFAGADLSAATSAGDRLEAPLPPPAARASAARVGQALPVGNEGAGTVVATGSSDAAQRLAGRVVSLAGGGMYAEYRVVKASACLVLPDGVEAAAGASSFVNPLTVLGMVETMRHEGHPALVHTAAASNLGQMLQRVCAEDGIPLVNVVRKPAQVELLRDQGAAYVVDSTAEGFMDDLTAALRETSATIAFDAVGGGQLASRILSCMERAASTGFSVYGSTVHKQVYIYGGLDRSPTQLARSFGMAWGVGGWLLTPFLQRAGAERVAALRQRVADGITTTFASGYAGRLSLAGALRPEAVAVYAQQSTGSKYLITPHGEGG